MSLAADRDGRDPEALHLVVLEEGRVVGTCRLLIVGATARLGRMVVAREHRRAGLGRLLLEEADRVLAGTTARLVRLHAQTYARGVYDRAGYEVRGDPFMEEGIEHVTMEKALA